MILYFLRKIKNLFRKDRVLKNIFNSKNSKKVLISYTVFPFLNNKITHTNYFESKVIAKVFHELGYKVDIIHYTNQKQLDYSNYNLIFGFGEPLENSFDYADIYRIYYATGAHVCFQNHAEIKRVKNVNLKKDTNLMPKRLVPWTWSKSIAFSDLLIVIGNDWIKSTYQQYTDRPIVKFNVTALLNENTKNITRDIKQSKKNFLWFGSSGAIHKGLDLCLDYFSKNKSLNLHICGPKDNEFFNVYSNELEKENIYFHGFINVHSEDFLEIVKECSFAILPTCSEAQVTSLLTCMGAGLIPVSTIYSAIDIDEYGILIEDLDLESVEKSVINASTLEENKIEKMSVKVQKYILGTHIIEKFEFNLKQIIQKLNIDEKNT